MVVLNSSLLKFLLFHMEMQVLVIAVLLKMIMKRRFSIIQVKLFCLLIFTYFIVVVFFLLITTNKRKFHQFSSSIFSFLLLMVKLSTVKLRMILKEQISHLTYTTCMVMACLYYYLIF